MEKIDKKLAFEFLKTFSLFEYGLKKTGFVRAGYNRIAEVDWDRWYRARGKMKILSPDTEVENSINYFLSDPVKKQVINTKSWVEWKPVVVKDDEKFKAIRLVQVVKVVRNNLFHGGKYAGEYVQEPTRNRKLMVASITILNAIVGLDKDLNQAILEAEANHYS